jgi:SAM-dependent methyltransferase
MTTSKSLARMRLFYNLFPYPNRSRFLSPDPEAQLVAHAGFPRLMAEGKEETARALWRSYRSPRVLGVPGWPGIARFPDGTGRCRREELESHFPAAERIALVGCGTDEPLLMRLLHPDNPLQAMDLSRRSLLIARSKEAFARLRARLRPGGRALRGKTTYVAGDAAALLRAGPPGTYSHIQCFGVLHHQEDPGALLAAMFHALAPGGTLRLMVYSHRGRRLERRIQARYSALWEGAEDWFRVPPLVGRLLWENAKLFLWRVAKGWFGRRAGAVRRFRYLGHSRAVVADALMHPSDPGLPLPDLAARVDGLGAQLLFCEAKEERDGWICGFGPGDADAAWRRIVEADACDALLSNVVAILRKPC